MADRKILGTPTPGAATNRLDAERRALALDAYRQRRELERAYPGPADALTNHEHPDHAAVYSRWEALVEIESGHPEIASAGMAWRPASVGELGPDLKREAALESQGDEQRELDALARRLGVRP